MIRITAEADSLRLVLADGSASLRLTPRLGLALPRYHFHIGRVVHAAEELGLFRVQTTLLLGNDLTGCAELDDWQADAALDNAGRAAAFTALIRAAQAEMAARPDDFGDSLVAELPGWRDGTGASPHPGPHPGPFWQGFGAHFYRGDPAAAEARLGPAWRSHLAALLPRQTVYLSFLGDAAQARLAQAADSAAPALAALRATGFQPPTHVRIDDGGPVLAWRQT